MTTRLRSQKHAHPGEVLPSSSRQFFAGSLLALSLPCLILTGHAQAGQSQAGQNQAGQNQSGDAAKDVKRKQEDASEIITVRATRDLQKQVHLSSPKKMESLLNTPQTLDMISSDQMSAQGAFSLVDALNMSPGISLQLGENGSTSTGDTFQLRGFSAQTSVFLDGIRDIGAISRDTFNVEQVEIAKGPAGSDNGRGTSAGYINLVSKLPHLQSETTASLSVFSQSGNRESIDSNIGLGVHSAFRLNLMNQDVAVAGRSLVRNRGYGLAPGLALGLGKDTRLYAFGQIVRQDNTPDGGLPTIGYTDFYSANADVMAGARVHRTNYYGSPSDQEAVMSAQATVRIDHDFASGLTLDFTTRFGETQMKRVLTGIGANSGSGISAPTPDPTSWTVLRTRQRVHQNNRILATTANLANRISLGTFELDMSGGLELTFERQNSILYGSAGMMIPSANLYSPDNSDPLPIPVASGAWSVGSTGTLSSYVLQTVKSHHWMMSVGVRSDSFVTHSDGLALTTATSNPPLPANRLLPFQLSKSGTLVSWNASVVYKPDDTSSLYIAAGNSLTPPASANFTLSTQASSLSNSAFAPTSVQNLEIGGKWDFLARRLSLTAAAYSALARDELTELDPVSNLYVQTGRRSISGLELGLTGQLSDSLKISAGLETLHTRIQSGTTGSSATGAATRWSPNLSGTVWATYALSRSLALGGGIAYLSDQLLVVDPAAPRTLGLTRIPAYSVAKAMVSYDVSPHLMLQLNINNLFDSRYISALNTGGSRLIPGQPRTTSLTLKARY